MFEALANAHRREIIYVLGLQPYSIHHLAKMRSLSLPAIHKHIKILESAGMVKRRKIGRTNFLTLDRESLRSLQDWLGQYHAYWGTRKPGETGLPASALASSTAVVLSARDAR